MKRKSITSLLIVPAAFCALCGCTQKADAPSTVPGTEQRAASPEGDTEATANALVDSLSREDFAAVVGHFDATMKAALPEAMLKQTWTSLTQQAGPFQSRGKSRVTSEMGYTVVYVECAFERANMSAKVVYNKSGEVSGLFLNKA